MRKLLLTILLPGMVLLSCVKKGSEDLGDLGGPFTLSGKVLVYDTLRGNYTYQQVHPLTIYLKYTSDNTGYLTAVTADAAGQYSFQGIDPAKAYTVYTAMDSSGMHYSASKDYPVSSIRDRQSDSLVLYPSQDNQNGIFYRTVDSTGALLAGANVYLFTSKASRDNKDTLSSVWDAQSDAFGRVLKMNLAPGTYYSYATAAGKNQLLSGTGTFTLEATKIVSDVLQLGNANVKTNSLRIYLVDSDQSPVANCNVYLYNNKALWNNPDDSTGVGSIVPALETDAQGKCQQPDLPAGTYYVRAFARFGTLSVRGSDSFSVGGDTVTVRKISVKITTP